MDARCPRKLKQPPQHFCPLAVARLRYRDAVKDDPKRKKELNEPKDAPGCPWAVRSHQHGYCYFKLMEEEQPDKLTDSQIAHLEGMTEAAVKKLADRALRKAANMKAFREIKESHGSDPLVIERPTDGYEDQLNDLSGITVTSDSEPSSADQEEP